MRLILFSDIHGNSYALNAFIADIQGERYDYLIFCGDIFGYYYNQKATLVQLCSLQKLIWLKGNHDEYFLKLYKGEIGEQYYIDNYGHSYNQVQRYFNEDDFRLISKLNSKYILKTNHGNVGIFHGTPGNSLEGRLYPDNKIFDQEEYQAYDFVVLGHTHCRMIREIGDTLIVNPGSLGQPRDGRGYSYAILDTDTKAVVFKNVQFDTEALYQQIDIYDARLTKLKEVLMRKAKD